MKELEERELGGRNARLPDRARRAKSNRSHVSKTRKKKERMFVCHTFPRLLFSSTTKLVFPPFRMHLFPHPPSLE